MRANQGKRHRRLGSSGSLATAVTVIGVAVPAASAQQADIHFGATVNVSADRENLPHVEPHLAQDPTNRQNLLVASMVYHESGTVARAGVYRSVDGGTRWGAVVLAEPVTVIDPWVEFDREGTAYFLHLPGRIHVSPDGGDRWERPVDLPLAGIGPLDFPKIVADRRPGPEGGRVYVVSPSVERDPAGLLIGPMLVFRSTPEGGFERTARILPARIDYSLATAPVVLPDGRLAISFSELSHAGELLPPGRVWITRSDDAGHHFAPPSLVAANGGGNLSMVVDKSGGRFHGRLYLAFLRLEDWNLYLTHSDDAGLRWSDPVRINDVPYRRLTAPIHPMLAVNSRGQVGILWPDFREDEEQRCYGVYFAYSDDGGESVSATVVVPGTLNCPDRPGGNQMAVDRPDGRRVVDRYLVGGDYYGLIDRPDERFQAVWSDARTGVFQLWSTTIDVRP